MAKTKYNETDMIMGYQRSVQYTGLFAGKVLRVRPSLKLFGSAAYEVNLTEELQKPGLTKIWVGEEFSVPFNQEKYEEALSRWYKYEEFLVMSKQEIEKLINIFKNKP